VAYEMRCLIYQELHDEIENVGCTWWLNANEQWKVLIGAVTFEAIGSVLQCTCTYGGNNNNDYTFFIDDWSECSVTSVPGNPSSRSVSPVGINYVRHEEQSDGIVPVSSAIAFPGAVANANTKLAGSNHQQMRNDSKLLVELTELFAGVHGTYFETDEQ
jgi:hypothetical protein